jgi:hypothetical protein
VFKEVSDEAVVSLSLFRKADAKVSEKTGFFRLESGKLLPKFRAKLCLYLFRKAATKVSEKNGYFRLESGKLLPKFRANLLPLSLPKG